MRLPDLRAVALGLFLLCVPLPLQADSGWTPPALDSLVAQALTGNPEIHASEERWQASLARARQAGVLEDPMLMLRIQNGLLRDPFDFGRDTMTAKVIGISQKLPWFGKRELMQAEAGLAAEADRWEVEERRIELRRMVKESWYQLAFVDRSLESVLASIPLLDDLSRLAESRYAVGKAGQQEVFRAQLERSKMEEMRFSLEQKRRSLVAAINALLFRPMATPMELVTGVMLTPLGLSAAELEAMAQANRPAIKALQARIERATASRRLAEKEFYPDLTLSFEYMQREPAMEEPGDDMYGAGVTFNLPVQQDQRRARVAETQAEQRMATHELAVLQNRVQLAISDGLARLERSQRQARLYAEGLLVQAGSAAESAMAAYRNDTATFAEVLESRMAHFSLERNYHEAVADHQMQLAALEGVVGIPLILRAP